MNAKNVNVEHASCNGCGWEVDGDGRGEGGKVYHEQCHESAQKFVTGGGKSASTYIENFTAALDRYTSAVIVSNRAEQLFVRYEEVCWCRTTSKDLPTCPCREASDEAISAQMEMREAEAVVYWFALRGVEL